MRRFQWGLRADIAALDEFPSGTNLSVNLDTTPLDSQNPTFAPESDLAENISIETIFTLHVRSADVNADGKPDLLAVGEDAS